MTEIDITKPIMTRGDVRNPSRPVRILCVDGPDSKYPVIGFIDGYTETVSWMADGSYNETPHHHFDLVPDEDAEAFFAAKAKADNASI